MVCFHFPCLTFLAMCSEPPGFCSPPAVLLSKVNFLFLFTPTPYMRPVNFVPSFSVPNSEQSASKTSEIKTTCRVIYLPVYLWGQTYVPTRLLFLKGVVVDRSVALSVVKYIVICVYGLWFHHDTRFGIYQGSFILSVWIQNIPIKSQQYMSRVPKHPALRHCTKYFATWKLD